MNRRLAAHLLATTTLLPGCYDAQALRRDPAETHEGHDAATWEEVDLGEFQVTLPHVLGAATDSIVEFHVFGHVQPTDLAAIDRALATRGPELRSRMLIAVRELTDAHFDEPKLTALREAIAQVLNAALEKPLVRKVGFYQFAFNTI